MAFIVAKFPELRVLAIDNYLTNIDIVEAMLTDLNCDFHIAQGNNQGFDLHATDPYDVVLMDLLVLDPDSIDTIQNIRSLPGDAGEIPIIAMVSPISRVMTHGISNCGVTNFLEKPFKISQLESTLIQLYPDKARVIS